MKLLVTLAVAVLLTFALPVAELTGSWVGSMETQGGTVAVTITIQSGFPVTGKVKAGEYESAIENAKVDGDKIAFETNLSVGKITFQGMVLDDEMKLTVTGTQGNQYPLTCKRQK